ncbi:MAG: hypothetical protein ACOCWO_01805, partial [Candidatus Muiribacteriaceae bacterium]
RPLVLGDVKSDWYVEIDSEKDVLAGDNCNIRGDGIFINNTGGNIGSAGKPLYIDYNSHGELLSHGDTYIDMDQQRSDFTSFTSSNGDLHIKARGDFSFKERYNAENGDVYVDASGTIQEDEYVNANDIYLKGGTIGNMGNPFVSRHMGTLNAEAVDGGELNIYAQRDHTVIGDISGGNVRVEGGEDLVISGHVYGDNVYLRSLESIFQENDNSLISSSGLIRLESGVAAQGNIGQNSRYLNIDSPRVNAKATDNIYLRKDTKDLYSDELSLKNPNDVYFQVASGRIELDAMNNVENVNLEKSGNVRLFIRGNEVDLNPEPEEPAEPSGGSGENGDDDQLPPPGEEPIEEPNSGSGVKDESVESQGSEAEEQELGIRDSDDLGKSEETGAEEQKNGGTEEQAGAEEEAIEEPGPGVGDSDLGKSEEAGTEVSIDDEGFGFESPQNESEAPIEKNSDNSEKETIKDDTEDDEDDEDDEDEEEEGEDEE